MLKSHADSIGPDAREARCENPLEEKKRMIERYMTEFGQLEAAARRDNAFHVSHSCQPGSMLSKPEKKYSCGLCLIYEECRAVIDRAVYSQLHPPLMALQKIQSLRLVVGISQPISLATDFTDWINAVSANDACCHL